MDFIEDAFLTDKKQHIVYGIDINSQHTNVTEYNNNDMILESKCNIVSSMKYEQNLDNNVINLITVCDTYLCYTVRSTLLRVINTITSEKALLRGHNFKIINLKFSSEVNSNTLCSVDNNTDTNTDHIFIWQLMSTNSLATSIINSFKLPASYIVPHPIHPYVWLIGYNGDTSSIGLVYNTTNSSEVKSYTDLPVHTSLKSTIIGKHIHAYTNILIKHTYNIYLYLY